MLKNENIICISSIDWDFVWQGHQEIMSTFARNGNRVLFIENTGVRAPTLKDLPRLRKRVVNWFKSVKGFREVMENVFVYSPVILPFPYHRLARLINKRLLFNSLNKWMKIMEFHNPIVWTFLPTGIALDIIDNVDKKSLIYYCIADFYALSDNPEKVKKTEDELIRKCDLIFAQGTAIKEKCSRINSNVHIFPFGVNIDAFDRSHASSYKIPADIKNIKKPIIGYIGGLHRHMDFNLIRFIAQQHPEWSIVLIGPIQTDISAIGGLKNVFLLGKKDFLSLSDYINEFDVGIIPYALNSYTESVFPTKLNEYHAMGKAVVSTDLPEIIKYNRDNDNLVLIGDTYEKFVGCISDALRNEDSSLVSRRIESARRNCWHVRIEEMSKLIEQAIEKKNLTSIEWRDKLLRFYKVTRRKVLVASVLVMGLYLSIFHTPLLWFIASPLKISQTPEKADCIVVFAGGVGESGKAGQGYEERLKYAVELYKKGYANHLIFSSGYTYAIKEIDIMKALAISMGVLPDAILLENRAGNTYENVKYTKMILDKEGWRSILLISSPYHMRRVSLVYNKIGGGLKITYTPVYQSRFYSHGTGASLEQIHAIIHEYLGILYYWRKGYI